MNFIRFSSPDPSFFERHWEIILESVKDFLPQEQTLPTPHQKDPNSHNLFQRSTEPLAHSNQVRDYVELAYKSKTKNKEHQKEFKIKPMKKKKSHLK